MKRVSFFSSRRCPVLLLAMVAGLAGGHLLRRSGLLWGGGGDGGDHKGGISESAREGTDAGSGGTAGHGGGPAGLKNQLPGDGRASWNLRTLSAKLALASRIERQLLLAAAVEKAPLSQMTELLTMAAEDPQAQEMIAARWVERNPQHLWRSMVPVFKADRSGGRAFGMNFDRLSSLVLTSWVKQDPAAVADLLDKGDGVPDLGRLRGQGINLLFAQDPDTALRLISRWGDGANGFDPQAVDRWIAQDTAHAAKVLSECGGASIVKQVAEKVGQVWAWTDPAGALEFAASRMTGSSGLAMTKGALGVWSAKAPAEAAAWIAARTGGVTRLELAEVVMATWQKSDPKGAEAWARSSLSGETRFNALYTLAMNGASTDMKAAQARTTAMEPGNLKNQITAQLALWMTQGDGGLQSAVDWLLTVPDAAARRSGLIGAVGADYTNDPEKAAELAAGPMAERLPVEFAMQAAANFANLLPQKAMDWVQTLPENRQNPARAEAWRVWLTNRPQEAMAWFNESPQAKNGREAMIGQSASFFAWQADAERGRMLANFQPEDLKLLRNAVEKLPMPDAAKKAAALKSLER